MAKTVTIRGKALLADFAQTVSKKRFCEIYAGMKPEVIEKGWSELLKATGRTEKKKPTKSEKRKKSS